MSALDPIGQFIGITIGAIKKAAVFAGELDRVDGTAPLIKSQRALAG